MLTIISLCTLLFLFFQKYDKDAIVESYDAVENGRPDEKDIPTLHEKSSAETKQDENLSVSNTERKVPAKIPYEEDWCMSHIDLNDEDRAFAEQEINNWKEKTGEIWQYRGLTDEGYTGNTNAELLEPYREMDTERLRELIKKTTAMQ